MSNQANPYDQIQKINVDNDIFASQFNTDTDINSILNSNPAIIQHLLQQDLTENNSLLNLLVDSLRQRQEQEHIQQKLEQTISNYESVLPVIEDEFLNPM